MTLTNWQMYFCVDFFLCCDCIASKTPLFYLNTGGDSSRFYARILLHFPTMFVAILVLQSSVETSISGYVSCINLSTCVLYLNLALCFELAGGIVNRPRNLRGANFGSTQYWFRWPQLLSHPIRSPINCTVANYASLGQSPLDLPHLWVYVESVVGLCWLVEFELGCQFQIWEFLASPCQLCTQVFCCFLLFAGS